MRINASIQSWEDEVHTCQVQCGIHVIYCSQPTTEQEIAGLLRLLEDHFGPGDLSVPSGNIKMMNWTLA